MEITKIISQKQKENIHNVDAKMIYNKPYAQVIILTLKPGESLKPHKTPVDVFFFVLKGKSIVEIGDEKEQVSKDAIIHSPKDIMHYWYNESDDVLQIMVAKTPNPMKMKAEE